MEKKGKKIKYGNYFSRNIRKKIGVFFKTRLNGKVTKLNRKKFPFVMPSSN